MPECDCADRGIRRDGVNRHDACGGLRGWVDPERAPVCGGVVAVDQAICGAIRQSLCGGRRPQSQLVACARVASRANETCGGGEGVEGVEVREGTIVQDIQRRRSGMVDVHAGVHRARRHHRCEVAVDVLSRRAAYGDGALADYDRARAGSIHLGCPHAANVWRRPHEVAVGREVVPHKDGGQQVCGSR